MPSAAYTAQAEAFEHQVQFLVEIDLDRCAETYTSSPCAASDAGDGSRCWYSWGTCQDQANYNKTTRTYKFCMMNVPWPDPDVQVYPLVKNFVTIPQEAKPGKLFVIPEKVKIEFAVMHNPPPIDIDKGSGFFNTAYIGEFWRNLVARNRNYPGRALRIYRGFNAAGFTESDFEQVGSDYFIRSIQIKRDKVVIEAESQLADIAKTKAPVEISDDNTVQSSINDSATSVTVKDATEYYDPANFTQNEIFVKMENEICKVTNVNTSTHVLTITRGQWGTTAASHAAGVKVVQIIAMGDNDPTTPTAITVGEALLRLLEFANIPAAKIDTTAFSDIDDSFWPTADILTTISRSEKVAKHMKMIRESRGIIIFIDENSKFSASAMAPDAQPIEIDRAKLVDESVTVKDDDEERLTRVAIFYDPAEDGSVDYKDFQKVVISIDAELEDENNYDDIKDENFIDRWLDPSVDVSVIRNITRRLVTRRASGVRIFSFTLPMRFGESLRVGDSISLISDEILDLEGNPDPRACFVTYRKESSDGQEFNFKAVDVNIRPGARGYFRHAPDDATDDWDTATDDDKVYGYWGDSNNRLGTAKEPGYIWW